MTVCRCLPSRALALSVACRSTSKPSAAAWRRTMPRRLIALRAVSAFVCQMGANVSRISFWSISATGTRPSLGRTCNSSGENQRPAVPSPFSSALRLSKASSAISDSMWILRAASRRWRSRSLIGSRPCRTTARAESAASRAALSDTAGKAPKPISRRRPCAVTRSTHCAPPSSRLCSHRPAPSACLPTGADLMPDAVRRFVARRIFQSPSVSPSIYGMRWGIVKWLDTADDA